MTVAATPGRELSEVSRDEYERLIDAIDYTLAVHGKIDADTPLHERIRKAYRVPGVSRLAAQPSSNPDAMNERRAAEDAKLAANVRAAVLAEIAKPADEAVREALKPFANLGGTPSAEDTNAGVHFTAFWDLPADTVIYHDNMGNCFTAGDVRNLRRALSAPAPPTSIHDAHDDIARGISHGEGEAGPLDPTNHHNALKCPYCNPQGLSFAPPCAGAAEPVAWRAFCSKTGGQMINPPATKDLLIEQADHLYAEHGYILQPLYAAPSVRGDREAIARTNLIRDSIQRVYDEMCVKFSGVHSDDKTDSWLLNLYASLKLLSLVQLGAGEREARAEDIAITLCLVDGREPDDEAPLSEMCDDANNPVPWWMVYTEYAESLLEKFNITHRNTLSRQAPHSSSEGGR